MITRHEYQDHFTFSFTSSLVSAKTKSDSEEYFTFTFRFLLLFWNDVICNCLVYFIVYAIKFRCENHQSVLSNSTAIYSRIRKPIEEVRMFLESILGLKILGSVNINTGTTLLLKTIVNYLKSN